MRPHGLIVSTLLLCACDRSTETKDPPTAKKVEPKTSADVHADAKPFPAGSLITEPVVQVFAVYAMPDGKSDVAEAAKDIRAKDYPHLALAKEGEGGDKPRVEIETPPMQEFAPLDPRGLQFFGRGLTDEQVQAVQNSPKVAVMTFVSDAASAPKIHADGLALAAKVAERTGGLLWDEMTREMFSLEAWRERSSAAVDDPKSLPRHFTIHSYRDGELVRMVTLGLAKFGLPDIVVERVPASTTESMAAVINGLAISMAVDEKVETEGTFVVDLERTTGEKVPKGAGRAELRLAVGQPDEGDPDNKLVEITFPGPRQTLHERQTALVDELLGSDDGITQTQHDEELLAASGQAKKELAELAPRFAEGVPDMEVLMVKAPFDTPDGNNEWMWVEVTSWNGKKIQGILQNTPHNVPGLAAGARVEVEQDSVFDYQHKQADGTTVGNKTGEILRRRHGG